jgi:hypothetical protein
MRQRPQFLDVPHFAGLQRLAHSARIIVHGFPCKYIWASLSTVVRGYAP